MQLSFLDQIKLRSKKSAPVEEDSSSSSTAPLPAVGEEAPILKPKNPLFGGLGAMGDGGGGMSFLEQIKSRRKVEA
jgi:hypothetical protein